MTRIIVHAGFHKTGTTSLQKYLAETRPLLAEWFSYYGQDDFKVAGARARIYAQKPFYWRRLRFRRAFAAFLAEIPDAKVIVLSRETFVGVMPGHRDWRGRTLQDFSAAIPLCQDVIRCLTQRFGKDTEIEFLFTTRERESWIRSVYGHLLRSIHLKETFEAFRAQFPKLIELNAEAQRIGTHLAPCKINVVPMETLVSSRFGPAKAILDLASVDEATRATLPDAKRANAGQSQAEEAAFLQMNQGARTKDDLRRTKDAMLGNKESTAP